MSNTTSTAQAYEWVKTGYWSLRQFREWFDALAKQEGQSNFCQQCEALARELKAIKQEQGEPVAYAGVGGLLIDDQLNAVTLPVCTRLYTTPQQRKPKFKEFIKWAGSQGYDCAQTCNSDTGEWIVLNPMTADLWKAWQAAHGIKE